MNKLTCRGCGKELENCTCDVLTTKKERTEKLKLIEIYDPCIPCEKEHNGECFDMECHSNARYNAKVSGANLQLKADQLVVDKLNEENARLNDIIGTYQEWVVTRDNSIRDLRERIKELEELILTKDDIRLIKIAVENEALRRYGNVKKDAPIFIRLAKLQKIIDKKG